MKIALLSFEYPPETGFGGIGTYTYYQARGLAKLGHEVHVLAGAIHPTNLRTTTHDGVTVHRFRRDGWLMRAIGRLDRAQLWWTKNRLENGLSMHVGLKALLRRHRFDLVEMPECGAEGFLINHSLPIPTLIKFHSPAQLIMDYYDVRRLDKLCCAAIEEWAIRGARALSSCSRFLADEVRMHFGIREAVRVIPNGIDLELFDKSESFDVRRKFNLPQDRPIILFSGRMEPRKGIHLCPEIVASITERYEVAFVFAGQDLFDFMAKMVLPHMQRRVCKGSLHYVGKLDLCDVRACLRAADIFLAPSLWENCPYSCLEAMAAGCAIVSSDQGGMPELIRHGDNGLLATNGSVAHFVAALEQLIEDRGLRERLGAAARRTVEESYTDREIARRSVEFYAKVLQGGSATNGGEMVSGKSAEGLGAGGIR